MPQNVRNFWFQASIDGKQNDVASGPVSKDGGLWMRFYQRDNGDVVDAFEVSAIARNDGTLYLRINDANGNVVFEKVTRR